MRLWFYSALAFWAQCVRAEARCIDPSELVRSTLSINRFFSAEERLSDEGLVGVRGTAWFLSPTLVVTAEHVTAAMRLGGDVWSRIEISGGEFRGSVAVRIKRVAGAATERIALLELATPVPMAQALQIRPDPMETGERVISIAYPGGRLRFAGGRFVGYGDRHTSSGSASGSALLEMHDGQDRLVLDHGASGAPVLDCQGRVVAVVSNLFTQAKHPLSNATRISTAWGQPNVASVPIQVLQDIAIARSSD